MFNLRSHPFPAFSLSSTLLLCLLLLLVREPSEGAGQGEEEGEDEEEDEQYHRDVVHRPEDQDDVDGEYDDDGVGIVGKSGILGSTIPVLFRPKLGNFRQN